MTGTTLSAAARAVRLVLGGTFRNRRPDRLRTAFAFAPPGRSPFAGGGATELNIDRDALIDAALLVRSEGARHLRLISMSDVMGRLRDFVTDNYHLLAPHTFLRSFDGPYVDVVPEDVVEILAALLASSDVFVEPRSTTLFPLVPVVVAASFEAPPFFLARPADLPPLLPDAVRAEGVVETHFPPMSDWSGTRSAVGSWLGIRAATYDAAKQMRAAVLGAIALLPSPGRRYMFSGRTVFGGRVTFDRSATWSFGDAHTPPLFTDLTIDVGDGPMLSMLAERIASSSTEHRKHVRALEYYHRAWRPNPIERFSTLFASLDAIFGDAGKATQAVVEAVSPIMGEEYSFERIRLLLGLRASVIHGGAPNVYESSKYGRYYRLHRTDALADLELITARCLQRIVFEGTLVERP